MELVSLYVLVSAYGTPTPTFTQQVRALRAELGEREFNRRWRAGINKHALYHCPDRLSNAWVKTFR